MVETEFLCPLCGGYSSLYCVDKSRQYYCCSRCQLVFVPKHFHLNSEQEKAEYDKHQNVVDDKGYRRFLSRLYEPVSKRIKPKSRGLDFGCGPGPALAQMFTESGCSMALYDVFYSPDKAVLAQTYHFITATEVVEHLSNPALVLDQIWSLVEPGGLLGLMTKRVKDQLAFSAWHYKNDPTHICFFHEKTFRFLAEKWDCNLSIIADDVVIFEKSDINE